MLTLLSREFSRALDLMEPEEMAGATPFSIATGVSAAPYLERLISQAREKCGTIAVSYTHLDVYKRQPQREAHLLPQ